MSQREDIVTKIQEAANVARLAHAQVAFLRALHPDRTAAHLRARQDLYFITCGDSVKIGKSMNPSGRLHEIQVGAPGPLRLLAVIPKAGHRESECHARVSHLRLYGEWFRWTPEVDALIKELSEALL